MMDVLTYKKDYEQILFKLKQIFDPNSILSNGRYIPTDKSLEISVKSVKVAA